MEKQGIALFKRKNKRGLTVLSILLSPLTLVALLVPQTLGVLPVITLILLGFVGPVSCVAVSVVFIGISMAIFGIVGGLCAALMLAPVIAVVAYTVWRNMPFWKSVGLGCAASFISEMLIVGALTLYAGMDIVSAFTSMFSQMIGEFDFFGDMLIDMLAMLKAIEVPAGGLDAATRAQTLGLFTRELDAVLRLKIPMEIALGSLSAGLLGQFFVRVGLLRSGEKVEMPPVRVWRIPKGWGLVIGLTVVAFWLMNTLYSEMFSSMFYVFASLAEKVFAIQGIAALDWMLHKHGKGKKFRFALGVFAYLVAGTAACIFGIGDQALDITRRRESLGDKADSESGKSFFDRLG